MRILCYNFIKIANMLTFVKRKPYEKIQTTICDDEPFLYAI